MLRRIKDKLKSNKGFSKEQITDTMMMLIVVTIILLVVIPISNKQKTLTKTIRDNEIKVQQKFSIND